MRMTLRVGSAVCASSGPSAPGSGLSEHKREFPN